ncbi:hypothetical protein RSOLAG22IIIB_02750 [Rhizoctonia solani]|uniref:Copper radical oxidase n=1 Tax=Rhizoctonia solani TaxID=456999 RepID=A0A0K6GHN1_9AGAM|nr:hypothetical protein RSOLAG22IIIB_02750 [Rhizoctonia solani]
MGSQSLMDNKASDYSTLVPPQEIRIRLTSDRWYPSSARLHDGSVIILGGQITAESVNNPTYESFPAKNINRYNGLQIPPQFFEDTLPHNTFPHVHALPSKKLFVAANNQDILLDWENNVETRLPNFPNGQRVVYPMNAAGVLLPLTPANNYTPEVFICGGSHLSQVDALKEEDIDAHHEYGSTQCSRMVLSDAGIAAGWQVEYMPEPRVIPEGVLFPNGKVVIINGGRTSTAGYGNSQYRIGDSKADNPTFTPLLYDPSLQLGNGLPDLTCRLAILRGYTTASRKYPLFIAAMCRAKYHTALASTLLPSGAILIGGSNPNDAMETRPWPSEYRVEYLNPSYMFAERPTYTGLPAMVNYGTTFTLSVSVPSLTAPVKAVLMDLGFITHSVHMDQKVVELVSTLSADRRTLTITAPPNAPGKFLSSTVAAAYLIMMFTQKLMIGTGAPPPKDDAATVNILANTPNPISGPH